MKVLLLTKENFWCDKAREFLMFHFGKQNVKVYSTNEKYKKIPKEILLEKGDLLISFLSPWIIPASLLNKFTVAINFHPGPPEYPGNGCYNFALYEGAAEYGVTCHFITEEVDAGPIIKVIRFQILPNETVKSLRDKSLSYLLVLFFDIVSTIIKGENLKPSGESWKRKAFTRKDLEELCKITPDMPAEEIQRRVRATYYPGMPGAYIELFGMKFYYNDENNFKTILSK